MSKHLINIHSKELVGGGQNFLSLRVLCMASSR